MKRLLSLIITFVLFTSLFAGTVSAAKKYPDVPDNTWYTSYVYKLAEKGIIGGYGSGKFGPLDNVLVAQMIKMVVCSLGYNNLTYYTGYVEKAKDLGLVESGEFPTKVSLERPITRAETARIIVRALKNEKYDVNLDVFAGLIKDYESVKDNMQDYVLKAYYLGIIGGYGSGNFGPEDKSNRAQASKMILCMIDPSLRLPPTKGETVKIKGYDVPVKPVIAIETDSVNNVDVFLGIDISVSTEPQYKELENILSSKFGSELINSLMEYVKSKKDRFTELNKQFILNGQRASVNSNGYNIQIVVRLKV